MHIYYSLSSIGTGDQSENRAFSHYTRCSCICTGRSDVVISNQQSLQDFALTKTHLSTKEFFLRKVGHSEVFFLTYSKYLLLLCINIFGLNILKYSCKEFKIYIYTHIYFQSLVITQHIFFQKRRSRNLSCLVCKTSTQP